MALFVANKAGGKGSRWGRGKRRNGKEGGRKERKEVAIMEG